MTINTATKFFFLNSIFDTHVRPLPHFRTSASAAAAPTILPTSVISDIRVRLRSGPRLPSHVLDCFLLLPWSHLLPCAFIFLSTIAFLPRALIAAALGLPSRPEASAAPARNSAWGVAGRVLNAWTTPLPMLPTLPPPPLPLPLL